MSGRASDDVASFQLPVAGCQSLPRPASPAGGLRLQIAARVE